MCGAGCGDFTVDDRIPCEVSCGGDDDRFYLFVASDAMDGLSALLSAGGRYVNGVCGGELMTEFLRHLRPCLLAVVVGACVADDAGGGAGGRNDGRRMTHECPVD